MDAEVLAVGHLMGPDCPWSGRVAGIGDEHSVLAVRNVRAGAALMVPVSVGPSV